MKVFLECNKVKYNIILLILTLNERSFIILFMKNKDENKYESIFNATIQLINEIGLAETSMSKIAKKANVSASTIYVYFENKEDLLNKLYLNVKKKMNAAVFNQSDDFLSLKEAFEDALQKFADFTLMNKDYFLFIEQFHNSPILNKISYDEIVEVTKPIFNFFEKGKNQQIFKQVNTNLLVVFTFQPVVQVLKDHFNGTSVLNQETLNNIIQMSWDAVKS